MQEPDCRNKFVFESQAKPLHVFVNWITYVIASRFIRIIEICLRYAVNAEDLMPFKSSLSRTLLSSHIFSPLAFFFSCKLSQLLYND